MYWRSCFETIDDENRFNRTELGFPVTPSANTMKSPLDFRGQVPPQPSHREQIVFLEALDSYQGESNSNQRLEFRVRITRVGKEELVSI